MAIEESAAKPVPTARIRFASWDEFVRFLMQENEGRGLFVRAGTPPPIGTDLMVQLLLPDGRELTLAARVVHRVSAEQSAEPGMGVQFTHMSEEQAARLQELMSNSEVTRSIHQAQSVRPVAAPESSTQAAGQQPRKPAAQAPALPVPEPQVPTDTRLAQALVQLERARFDAAERLAMDVLADDPTDTEAQKLLLVAQARRLRSQFDFDRALQKYRAVLKLDPSHPEAREQLAGLDTDIERSRELFDRVFGGKSS